MLVSPVFAMMVLVKEILLGFERYVYEGILSQVPFVVVVFVMTLLLLIPNLIVFRIVQKQKVQIESQCRHIKASADPSSSTKQDFCKRREVRSFYLCFGCVITFVLCWLPQLTFKGFEIGTGTRLNYRYIGWAAIITTLNPFLDAWFFVWFNKKLRGRLKDVFKRPPRPPQQL